MRALDMGRPGRGAFVLALAILAAGCGAEFKLPTEHRADRAIPSDGSYQMIATWTGLTGVADVLLVPGPQLFLLFKGAPGRVFEFSTTAPIPLATDRFAGLMNPAALAASPGSVFVLDQGDTLNARATVPFAYYVLDCGPLLDFHRPLVDDSLYWHVFEYDSKGRSLKSSFTDTTFAWVNGIAADDQGRVYVSGVIMYCIVDRFDTRLRTLDRQFRIRRYVKGSGDPYVIGGWKRDPTFEITEGSGIGFARDPRGMAWSAATGAALLFANFGHNEEDNAVQKFDLQGDLSNSFKLDICDADTTLLVHPIDVDVDEVGSVFVVDSGNRRVLRYDSQGRHCIQRVDLKPNSLGLRLTRPVAVAAGDVNGEAEAYVVDAGVGQVVRYRRHK
jgi:hypothetical protein